MVDISNAPIDVVGELASRMEIEFLRADAQCVELKMPVVGNRQGMFILHGGANGVLVEHAGSILAVYNTPEGRLPVGTELSVSQLHPARSGYVTAKATVVSIGRSSMCTSVEIHDEEGNLTALGRMSLVFIKAEVPASA